MVENHYLNELKEQTEDDFRYTLRLRWAKVCQEIPANMPVFDTLSEDEFKQKTEENL